MKRLLLALLLFTQYSFADDNGLPLHYGLMDGKTPVYIEFTDVIQDRYMVDVEWFPDWGLAPFFTGRANINFKLVDRDVKFTVKANLFHISQGMFSFPKYRIDSKTIVNQEIIKMKFRELADAPFAFGDMNFDGIKELVLFEKRGGQRGYDAYKVYLIQEIENSSYFNIFDLSNVKPYSDIDQTTKFDSDNKTIEIYYSGGACSSSYELYERVFSDFPMRDYKFKLIKKTEYSYWDEDGNDIPCHKYVYDVVNGREILIESESGSVE